MNRYAPLYIGGLVVFGALVALFVGRNPGMEDFVVPPFWWPLFAALAEAGAETIAVPAAFTVPTGQAH